MTANSKSWLFRMLLKTSSLIMTGLVLADLGCSTSSRADSKGSGSSNQAQSGRKKNADSTLHRAGQEASASEASEDKTVLAVSRAIRRNHLVSKPDQCIAYQFDGSSLKDAFVVDVREDHSHSECGGDPQTSPRLFTVRVSKKTGKMSTDANSPAGEFHSLPK